MHELSNPDNHQKRISPKRRLKMDWTRERSIAALVQGLTSRDQYLLHPPRGQNSREVGDRQLHMDLFDHLDCPLEPLR